MATDLGLLADHLGELATIPSRVSATIAADFDAFIDECFANASDPYGNAWEPLADSTVLRKGFATPLEESGDLRSQTGAFPLKGAGIEFRSATYGFFHNAGTVSMPARKFLPDGPELPVQWSAAVTARLRAAFGGARA
jgi:hypothetical protein